MGIVVEHRNVNEVCAAERIDAVVRPCFKFELPCVTPAKEGAPYRFDISTYYPDLMDEDDAIELIGSYTEVLEIAKEKGLKKIVFPLICADFEDVPIEEILGTALQGIREGIEGSDIEVTLALDYTAEKRLLAAIPEEIKKEEQREFQEILQIPEIRKPSHFVDMMVTSKTFDANRWGKGDFEELPEELRNYKWRSPREEVGKILLEYLKKHDCPTKGKAWEKVSVAMSRGAFYNIFDPNIEGDVSKKSLLIACIGCGLSLEETEEVLDAGGYKFTHSTEDDVIKYVLKHSEEFKGKDKDALYACNGYLIGCKCPPMFEE